MPRDPFSRTLELIDARTIYAGGFIGGGAWAIRFPPPDKIKIFVVARGSCQVTIDGMPEPMTLQSGDVFLLTRSLGFTLASDLAVAPEDAARVFRGRAAAIVPVGSCGDDVLILGGHIDTSQAGARLIAGSLPGVMHLAAAESGAGRLAALIEDLVGEAAGGEPGAAMACSSLAHLVIIQVLRRQFAAPDAIAPGWLRAACDPRFIPVLSEMQARPAHPWTLAELASAAAMSRTAFINHFKKVSGMPPLAYLTEWRMRQAERALQRGDSTVAAVAEAVGYSSEAAFSTAFKRVIGRSPRRAQTDEAGRSTGRDAAAALS